MTPTGYHMTRPAGCHCPAAPCGLTDTDRNCRPHRRAFRTIRLDIHEADRCPGEAT